MPRAGWQGTPADRLFVSCLILGAFFEERNRKAMPTVNQLIRKGRNVPQGKTKTPALAGSPQKRGVCTRVYTTTPRKPTSALRKVAPVRPTNGQAVNAHIPCQGQNVPEHSDIIIPGGQPADQ